MSRNRPKVSVVMPAWNAGRTLRVAVDSVLQQTCSDFELIVCDDASSDETLDILGSCGDARLRVLCNDRNRGEGWSRDQAIASARGRWIAVIDADDAWLPNRLDILLLAAGEREDVLVFDDILQCHDAPSGMVPWRRLRGASGFAAQGSPVDVAFSRFIESRDLLIKPIFPTALIKDKAVKHSLKKFAADTEYFLRLVESGAQLIYVPEPMYLYRITPGSMTSNPHRGELMLEVLKEAKEGMSLSMGDLNAMDMKIRMVMKEIEYGPVLHALKKNEWLRALRILARNPELRKEFVRRLVETIPYRTHRLMKRAKGR